MSVLDINKFNGHVCKPNKKLAAFPGGRRAAPCTVSVCFNPVPSGQFYEQKYRFLLFVHERGSKIVWGHPPLLLLHISHL